MPEELLIQHCAPTLAGIKTGNILSCSYPSREEMVQSIRSLNSRLGPKGLRVIALRYCEGRALVYVFRPAGLAADLASDEARAILEAAGYRKVCPNQCVRELMRRLEESGCFPHEIGLFLSYPPEDVRGFIENKGGGYKCVGCWKVYGDAEKARKTFEQYKQCTSIYSSRWSSGVAVEDLTVAIS